VAAKSYGESLSSAKARSGLAEAVVIGTGRVDGREIAIGVMDFRFIGASMGSVVGEKIARLFELAAARSLPVVVVTASGGARMQEGILSLMQMAGTSAAVRRHAETGLPYLAILTDPTYGGVTASFATLADVILAEPGAHIGFAGPVVIEQTIRQKIPKGFQTAESLLKHGMIDDVVPRGDLRERVALLLSYLDVRERGDAAPTSAAGQKAAG
jgi:acetyl-CoA carboxylase carboxyl transferase subunit beta